MPPMTKVQTRRLHRSTCARHVQLTPWSATGSSAERLDAALKRAVDNLLEPSEMAKRDWGIPVSLALRLRLVSGSTRQMKAKGALDGVCEPFRAST